MQKSINIALVISPLTNHALVADLIDWASIQDEITIQHVLVIEQDKRQASMAEHFLWRLIHKKELKKLKKTSYKKYFDHVDVSSLAAAIHLIKQLNGEASQHISHLNLDYVLDMSDCENARDWLMTQDLKLISLQCGQKTHLPACFAEVFTRTPTSALQICLHQQQKPSQVLFAGAILTQNFWLKNLASVQKRGVFHLKRCLLTLAKNCSSALTIAEARQDILLVNNTKASAAPLRYLVNGWREKLVSLNLFTPKMKQRWGVAFLRGDWKNKRFDQSIKIENPHRHFLADPFVYTKNGQDFCFVEDYSYDTKLGTITVYALHKGSAKYIGEALNEPFHLSFPYLFEHNDALYMVPETSQNRDIRIYECLDFPLKWQLKSVVMRDLSAADTMIFQHDGRWWLLTNINPLNENEHCSELWAFYADNPLSCEWTPHANNPVIVDANHARNGGMIIDGDTIYRTAQKQGFNQYGAGSSIRKVTVLTPQAYEEEVVEHISPNFFDGLLGTHHFHHQQGVSVFDFVKREKI